MKKLIMVFLLAPLAGCLPNQKTDTPESKFNFSKNDVKQEEKQMLDEIYAMKKPEGFEQIDVSPIVIKYIPIGTERLEVLKLLKNCGIKKIIENSDKNIITRDDLGLAMFDPNARSVVMKFAFDPQGKLFNVDAVYIKNQ